MPKVSGRVVWTERDGVQELQGTDKIRGPLGRVLATAAADRAHASGAGHPAAGFSELEQSVKLIDAGDYIEAEKQLKRLAKKHKDSALEEEALFQVAEAQELIDRSRQIGRLRGTVML